MTDECEISLFYSPLCMQGARVTGTSAPGFDAQNLTKGRLPWMATGISGALQIEFPAERVADTLILAATNLSFDAQITLAADGDDVGALSTGRYGPEPDDCFGSPGGSLAPAALINDVAQRGDGATTIFIVGGGAGLHVAELQVFIDGLRQRPTTDYAVVDSGFDLVLTFTSAPPDGAKLHFYAATELLNGAGIEINETQAGNGSSDEFTLTGAAGMLASEVEIYIDGLRQIPDVDYTAADSGGDLVITFDSAPASGAVVYFYADFDSTQSPGFGPRVLDADAVGDAATVVFDVPSSAGVTTNALEVFIDGIRQQAGADYRSTSLGSFLSVTFFTPPPDGSVIMFYADSGINAAVGYDVQSEDWPRRNIFVRFPETEAKVWTLTIFDPNNKDGQLRILRAIIDLPKVAEHIQDGWSIESLNLRGEPVRTLSGAVIPPSTEVYRRISIKTTLMSNDNAYAQMRRDLALGFNQELFIVPCPDDAAMIESTSFLCVPVDIPPFQSRGQFDRWSRPLVGQEIY